MKNSWALFSIYCVRTWNLQRQNIVPIYAQGVRRSKCVSFKCLKCLPADLQSNNKIPVSVQSEQRLFGGYLFIRVQEMDWSLSLVSVWEGVLLSALAPVITSHCCQMMLHSASQFAFSADILLPLWIPSCGRHSRWSRGRMEVFVTTQSQPVPELWLSQSPQKMHLNQWKWIVWLVSGVCVVFTSHCSYTSTLNCWMWLTDLKVNVSFV